MSTKVEPIHPARKEAIRLWEYRHELATGGCKPCNKMKGALPGDLVLWYTHSQVTRCYLVCTYSRPGGGGMYLLVEKDWIHDNGVSPVRKEVGSRSQPLVNHDHTFRLLQHLLPDVPTPFDMSNLEEWRVIADWIEEYNSSYSELATLLRIERSMVSSRGGWEEKRLYHDVTAPLHDAYIFLRNITIKKKGK